MQQPVTTTDTKPPYSLFFVFVFIITTSTNTITAVVECGEVSLEALVAWEELHRLLEVGRCCFLVAELQVCRCRTGEGLMGMWIGVGVVTVCGLG